MNYEGVPSDLVKEFVDQEFLAFPVAIHDDMLDALARVLDEELPLSWPISYDEDEYDDRRQPVRSTGY